MFLHVFVCSRERGVVSYPLGPDPPHWKEHGVRQEVPPYLPPPPGTTTGGTHPTGMLSYC